jgi:hypothetical protein
MPRAQVVASPSNALENRWNPRRAEKPPRAGAGIVIARWVPFGRSVNAPALLIGEMAVGGT